MLSLCELQTPTGWSLPKTSTYAREVRLLNKCLL